MSRKLLVGTVLLAAGILAAVFEWNVPRVVYTRSVSEFLAHPVREQLVRIDGALVHGSLCRRIAPCGYEFRLVAPWPIATHAGPSALGSELSVRYPHCVVPESFQDRSGVDVQILVEGELCANCHRFEASQIFTRDYSWYFKKRSDGGDGGVMPEPAMRDCPGS